MKKYLITIIVVISLVMIMAPFTSSASTVTLPPAPSSLPSVEYNYNGTNESVTGSDWISFFQM